MRTELLHKKTEDTVGSYILHDFCLYYTLRYGMKPNEIFELCQTAVKQSDEYKFDDAEIKNGRMYSIQDFSDSNSRETVCQMVLRLVQFQ